ELVAERGILGRAGEHDLPVRLEDERVRKVVAGADRRRDGAAVAEGRIEAAAARVPGDEEVGVSVAADPGDDELAVRLERDGLPRGVAQGRGVDGPAGAERGVDRPAGVEAGEQE